MPASEAVKIMMLGYSMLDGRNLDDKEREFCRRFIESGGWA